MAVSFPTQQLYVTDGLTRKDDKGVSYISYRPLTEDMEIRDKALFDRNNNMIGRLRDIVDKDGKTIMSIGAEGGLYTAEKVLGKNIDTKA